MIQNAGDRWEQGNRLFKIARLHLLEAILTIAILAVIAGAKGWENMELYVLSKHKCLFIFVALPNGIPSADTFRRVFEKLNPKEFEQAFEAWVRELVNASADYILCLKANHPTLFG